jgi:hypothetical protein
VTEEEIQHLRHLRKATRARLNELEIQAASFGPATVPAHISIDIRAAKEEIERIDSKLRLPTISPEVQEATGPEAGLNVLRTKVEHLGDMITTALLWSNNQLMEMRNESRDYRVEQDTKRAEGVKRARLDRMAILVVAIVAGAALVIDILLILGRI